jgi:hypothetical protein
LGLDEIQNCFRLIFLDEHDTARTETMHTRYTEKKRTGEDIIGAGTFIKKVQDVGLEKVSSWLKKLTKLTGGATPGRVTPVDDAPGYFEDDQGFFCKRKYDKGNLVSYPLANFCVQITEQITEDDGNERALKYRMAGSCMHRPLPQIEILAHQFGGMAWVHQYGSRAIIEPGNSIRDTLRHGIQVRSTSTKETKCYVHTGWRDIDGRMVFLSHSSAIGGAGIDVQLSKENTRYSLPTLPEDEILAIRTSLSFLDIGTRDVTLPIFSAVYIAPLTSLFSEFQPINFSFYAYGATGTFKTTLAVLGLCHFGNFNASALPNLEDTGNSIERRAFLLKDVLMVLDDYHPSGQRKEAEAKEALVQRAIREFSNRTGRGRLNSDSKERGRYFPRGVLMVTGEEIAVLQSTIARIFVIEINQGDVDIAKLTRLQAMADSLPHAMSSFIHWILDNMDRIRRTLPVRFRELRQKATEDTGHRKLPEQRAFLTLTLEIVSAWLVDRGVFTGAEGKAFVADGWETFRRLTERHGERIKEEDPVRKFNEIILAMLRTGKIRLERIAA